MVKPEPTHCSCQCDALATYGEYPTMIRGLLDDLASSGAHGMTRGEINLFIDHWADQQQALAQQREEAGTA